MRSIFGVLVSALFVVGCAGSTPSAAPAASAPGASQSGAFGGSVQFKYHGQPSTTTVDAVADGTSVSGTAVTQIGGGTHTVKLGCAAQSGDMWAVAGKTEKSNVEGGRAGDWSAVIMKLGSPAKIGVWVSDDASTASDCDAWLKVVDLPTLDLTGFETVESGTLLPPPASAFPPQAAPSASGATKPGGFGGVVQFRMDGRDATTTVDGVADNATVTGTAVTKIGQATHNVQLGCASQNGDTWALGGTVANTTVSGEKAGDWSAVIVKSGSPQKVGIWLSDDPSSASDCTAWLKAIDFSTIDVANFNPVDSGTLTPPAFPAS